MARRLRLRFYGRLRETAGAAEREADVPDDIQTADDLVAWIADADQELGKALGGSSVKVAADDTIVPRGTDIRQAAEVSFLPPFSGG
jgi:molybdopterin synthase sulfur carrier subunit